MSYESNSPTSPLQDSSQQANLNRSSNANAASTSAGPSGGQSFFEKERTKIVAEIAEGIELLLSDSNSLNRKIEESISVGKEFEPIAALWGRFSDIMRVSGVDSSILQEAENLSNSQSGTNNNRDEENQAGRTGGGEGSSKDLQDLDEDERDGNEQGGNEFTTPKASSKHTTNPLNQSAKKSLNRSRNGNDENEAEILSRSQGAGNGEFKLPRYVAPGGGMIYGQD